MKKLYSLSLIAIMLMSACTLVSCDEDVWIADSLEGTWEGPMNICYEYNNRVYESLYTEICFELDPFRFRRGSGYWIDHYQNYGWGRDYVANHIAWEVVDKVIHIHFLEDGTDLFIEDYTVSDAWFMGYIYDGDARIKFKMRHTYSPHWDEYEYGIVGYTGGYGGYGGYDGYYDGYGGYYAPKNPNTTNQKADKPKVRRFIKPN